MKQAKRPYVICHMVPSVDGRIVVTRWKPPASVYAEYERTAGTFGANAWMIGRISMEPYAGKARVSSRKVPHADSENGLHREARCGVLRHRPGPLRQAHLEVELHRRGARDHGAHRAGLG